MLGAPGRRSVPPQYAKAWPSAPCSPKLAIRPAFRLRFAAWRSSVPNPC